MGRRRSRWRPFVVGMLVAMSGGASQAACAHDWTVGSAPPDAGQTDARAREDVVQPPASEAGTGDAADYCAELVAAKAQALAAARACTGRATDECDDGIEDECECDVSVTDRNSATSTAYEAIVEQFLASSCPRACTGSCGPARASSCSSPNGDGVCL